MPILTRCPACNRQVRVPDQLFGKRVKCATCGHVFQAGGAPPAQPEFAPAQPRTRAPEPDEYQEPQEDYEDQEPERPRRRKRRRFRPAQPGVGWRLLPPAICLLVAAIVMIGCGVVGLIVVASEADLKQAMRKRGQEVPETEGDLMALYALVYGAYVAGPMLQGLGIIVGASCMMIRKVRGLAIAGSVVAMLPCTCCILSLPFGIWSMIVLMNDDVKDAFT